MRRLPVSKGDVLVVGDLDFIELFKAAGVKRCLRISGEVGESVINEVVKAVAEGGVNFIVIQDSLRRFFEGRLPHGLGAPVVFIPDLRSARTASVKEYYSSLIRRYLGISLELG